MSSGSAVRLPPISDPRWIALVKEGPNQHVKVLALQLILARIRRSAKADPSPANVKNNVDELAQFFAKNARMLEADTAALFG